MLSGCQTLPCILVGKSAHFILRRCILNRINKKKNMIELIEWIDDVVRYNYDYYWLIDWLIDRLMDG